MTQRKEFEAWAKPILGDNPTWRESGDCELVWQAWQAAQAAQPAGKVCVTTDQAGAIVAVTRQDSEGRILEVIAESVQPPHAHAIDTSPGWIAVSEQLPTEEEDGEVLVRMRDGRPEIAWATYWHGASIAFAGWTFRDPDEDETPAYWMPLPAAPSTKEGGG